MEKSANVLVEDAIQSVREDVASDSDCECTQGACAQFPRCRGVHAAEPGLARPVLRAFKMLWCPGRAYCTLLTSEGRGQNPSGVNGIIESDVMQYVNHDLRFRGQAKTGNRLKEH